MRRPLAGLIALIAIALSTTGALVRTGSPPPLPVVTVYKSPTCGCCSKWVEHLKAAGFPVEVHDVDDVSAFADASGVPGSLRSCHTAVVKGYAIEGHVPADLIKRLLDEHPKIAGLAVPGMVTGSPGMEGNRKDAYDVIAWSAGGKTSVFARR
jgi:hypothetical protein